MDRRGFLRLFGGAATAAVAAPLIPFGRIWSFPSKIVIPKRFETIQLQTVAASGWDWAYDPRAEVTVFERWSYDPMHHRIWRETSFVGNDGVIHRLDKQSIPWDRMDRMPVFAYQVDDHDRWAICDEPIREAPTL